MSLCCFHCFHFAQWSCFAVRALAFHSGELRALWSQFNILKSCKTEAENSHIHFWSLLEPCHTARLISPFIFHVDFGGFIIQFMCWAINGANSLLSETLLRSEAVWKRSLENPTRSGQTITLAWNKPRVRNASCCWFEDLGTGDHAIKSVHSYCSCRNCFFPSHR